MEKFSKEKLWEQLVQSTDLKHDHLDQCVHDSDGNVYHIYDYDNPEELQEGYEAGATIAVGKGSEKTLSVVPTQVLAQQKVKEFTLDKAEPLDERLFPNEPKSDKSKVPATIANISFLLKGYGITVRYNLIKKSCEITIPGLQCSLDNADNVALTQIKDLARLNNMSTPPIDEAILAIADRNPYNPVRDWIIGKPWDGVDRLEEFYATLKVVEGYSNKLKKRLIFRWLLSAIAAIFKPQGFKSRGVLTIQGPQSIGKTSWIAALIPDENLREEVIKLDHHMDAGDKDAKISALLHWIVEIGELDGSFKKNIARLKGFITSDYDKIRVPYGKNPTNFQRRTVFCATVNDASFLVDTTGNSRWWTIAVTGINYQHNIDMQQVWAQIKTEYDNGEQWWLTQKEEKFLESYNYNNHRTVSSIEDLLLPNLDLNRIGEQELEALTASQTLRRIGKKQGSNASARECGTLLRKHLGAPKKIRGAYVWRVPFDRNAKLDF